MSEMMEFGEALPTRTASLPSIVGGDPARINICALDSHPVVQYGLECKIRSQYDMHWVGSGRTFPEVAAILRETTCDIVIVEYQLEGLANDGWNLIKQFQRNFPHVQLLIFTGHMSKAIQHLICRSGAARVLSKCESLDHVIGVIRELGFASWHARFHGDHKRARPAPPIEVPEFFEDSNVEALQGAGLSTREMEVLRCLLQGLSVTQISHKFVRSIKTISSQKQAAFRKLSVSSNQDLFRLQKSFHI